MCKEVAYSDNDIEFLTEDTEGKRIIHCNVYNYNKSVLERLAIVFSDIKYKALQDGYSKVWAVSKNHKFCLMGGGVLSHYYNQRGQEFGVYVWETT